MISENVELSPKFKTREDIESATDNFISTLQQADHLATPIRTPQRYNYIYKKPTVRQQ